MNEQMAQQLAHIVERFVTHLYMDGGFLLSALLGFEWLRRRRWIPSVHAFWVYLAACSLVIFVAWAREPFDVAGGQLTIKVITDWASHVLGTVGWCYSLYRLGPRLGELSQEFSAWRGKQ